MSEIGGFFVHRKIWDHDIFRGDEFSCREAWIWLISSAAWKPVKIRPNGTTITLERGEFSFSVRFLAEKFRWHRCRVERVLLVFKKQDMIRDTSRDGAKVYFVSNYNDYQLVPGYERDATRDGERDTSETRARHERDKEESLNKGISESKEKITRSTDVDEAMAFFNSKAELLGWPRARLTKNRRAKLNARLKDCGGIEGWRAAMERAGASDFLAGRVERTNGHENWSADFDFFLQESSFAKLTEGKYDNRHQSGVAKSTTVNLDLSADALAERLSWLREYAFDGRWIKNTSGNGVWKDSHGVGPPPHEFGTFVTDEDLDKFPKAKSMKEKLKIAHDEAPSL